MVEGITWISQFDNFSDYFINLMPNLLAQSIVLNNYLQAIEVYTEQNN